LARTSSTEDCAKRKEEDRAIARIINHEAIWFCLPEQLSRGDERQAETPCPVAANGAILESVSKLDQGLRSFRSMRRMEASFRNASALGLRFSQSLAERRQRLSHAMVRSTIQRLGNFTNPLLKERKQAFH